MERGWNYQIGEPGMRLLSDLTVATNGHPAAPLDV